MTPVAHKFGGSSVADAECYARVGTLLDARREEDGVQVVVVSAMKGVTDALIRLGERAAAKDPAWRADFQALEKKHLDTARTLLGSKANALIERLAPQLQELSRVLETLGLLGGPSDDGLLYVQGLGEVYSAQILSAHLGAHYLDAREVLVVERTDLGVMVDWPESQARFDAWLAKEKPKRVIVTGFVAREKSGRVTTLGRNGSDYSGAIFGALAKAREIHIWTDVDGVLSADPRQVPEAVLIDQLSYAEACELAYFGAKVIHPQTMAPAISRGIPLRIRNTFNAAHPGTVIAKNLVQTPPVKGLTAFGGLAMVTVEGSGMVGVSGTAERVFAALQRAKVPVLMITQGSSEHSICCVVPKPRAAEAVAQLQGAFRVELDGGLVESVESLDDLSLLAVVGDGMAGVPGTAARLFSALARSGTNVRAIAQGSSERNISVVVDSRDAVKALRAVHAGFYLSPQTLSVGVIGPGQVGQAFLDQLLLAKDRLLRDVNLDVRVRAIVNRSRMVLDEKGLPASGWRAAFQAGGPSDLERFAAHVDANHLPHCVIVDCSASDEVVEQYPRWLERGIHIITPSKHAGSGPKARYQQVKAATAKGARFRYEATVGAGLPIITTLRDLLDTGDEVLAIEGMLSGTLAWLFNKFDGAKPFSELVREAKALGYTEPDPRDDLSGTDVARKVVILARELGLDLSLEQVDVESLVPPGLRANSVDDFLAKLEVLDAPMKQRLEQARAQGTVLRYVARLDREGTAKVGVAMLSSEHAFAHSRLTDNVVQFTTQRYRQNPLTVQGPGAGPQVTAAGVFADLLRVAAGLGAKL